MDYLAFKKVYHDDLLHFGIKRRSGRYPYGSGERPFQGEGGRKTSLLKRKKEEKLKRKQDRRINPADMKKSFQSEEEKQKLLKTASSATEILQYRDELTNNELLNALNRIKTTRELRDISKREIDSAWDAVDDAMKKVGKVKNWAKTGVDSYGVILEIVKILNGEYGGNQQQGQQSQKKKK